MNILSKTIPLGPYGANCTILWHDDGSALIIDPGADGDLLAGWLSERKLTPSAIFLTHAHFDHISGVDPLLARFPAPILMHAADEPLAFSPFNLSQPGYAGMSRSPLLSLFSTEDTTIPGWPEAKILHTPGHSPGSCCLHFSDEALLVAGDTLFEGGSYGRYDLPGGSWEQLEASLRRLAVFPGKTQVICGHGGGTTISAWREFAPFPIP
ncbi:MAG: MBL fold metallo-hydrolase [Kiritimatiellae bacterium]|nr:MBL fold metallo-hydrolase [Kiritimatiellia bacterium]